MKLATIVPTKYLWLTADEDYHMCLAHLIGEDEEYTNFFRDMSARGHYVIMDNSVIENAQVTIAELCAKARLIEADEIVLPDKFRDKEGTLKTSKEALDYVRLNCPELKVMVVPQGRNLNEWYDCFWEMLPWNVDCIGIPKVLSSYNDVNNLERGLVLGNISDAIVEYNELHPGKPLSVHLLGCWNSPLELTIISKLESEGEILKVRGCDSAIAYAFSQSGCQIGKKDRVQGLKVSFADECTDLSLLEYNIKQWHDSVDLSKAKLSKVVELY